MLKKCLLKPPEFGSLSHSIFGCKHLELGIYSSAFRLYTVFPQILKYIVKIKVSQCSFTLKIQPYSEMSHIIHVFQRQKDKDEI